MNEKPLIIKACKHCSLGMCMLYNVLYCDGFDTRCFEYEIEIGEVRT